MKFIDRFLNQITMYRLTLYYLMVLVGVAVVFSFFNLLSYHPLDILINTGIILIICYVANFVFAKLFRASTNTESVFITSLILLLIIPVKFPLNATFFILAGGIAMASKYLVTIEKKHIFNPAAVAVAAVSLLSPEHAATWWVGTPWMLPFVLIGGLLLMRKTRRETLVFSFLFSYFVLVGVFSFVHSGSLNTVVTLWQTSVMQSALLFFTFVMLTEPLTSPVTEKKQTYYSMLTALLYATPQLRLGFVLTPEQALCLGNIFAYIVSPKYRLVLTLQQKIQVAADTFAFVFPKPQNFHFVPGQYMEWLLPHPHVDSRGNRRYFSLASSPTESVMMLLIRFYTPPSSFKNALLQLPENNKIIAGQLSGDFVLPQDLSKPLVFIAGGVGIAPFRSMIQYIVDKKLSCNIVVVYANRHQEDIAFADVLQKAKAFGVRSVYILTDTKAIPANWSGEVGYLDEEKLKRTIPDFATRVFYLSGPQLMVERFESLLLQMGIKKKNIVTDYFPGYAEK